MIAIALDFLAAYALKKYFSTKRQYFLMGLIAGVTNAMAGAFLVGMWLDEPPGVIVTRALSGVLPHTIFIFICLFFALRLDANKANKRALADEEKNWDEDEQRVITDVLKNNQDVDLSIASRNEALEENLARLSTEEIIERIQSKNFAVASIPSALRVLRSRKKVN